MIAVPKGKRIAYFRHKGYEEHCHYNSNEALKSYIWDILEDANIINELNLSLDKLNSLKLQKNSNKTDHSTYINISKDNNIMTLIIDGIDYKIRLYFEKNDQQNQDSIHIFLVDLIKYEDLSGESIIDIISNPICDKSIEINKKRELLDKDIQSLEKINILCPKCKGTNVYRVKLKNGKSLRCKDCY